MLSSDALACSALMLWHAQPFCGCRQPPAEHPRSSHRPLTLHAPTKNQSFAHHSPTLNPASPTKPQPCVTDHWAIRRRFQDPIVERVERRISMATRLPVAHQEEIQVLRYTKGQKYR
eukprot:364721-Chlamydomonas_euryale.AAC.15